jgi:hypothetical protein
LSLQPVRWKGAGRGAGHFLVHSVLFGLAAAAPLLLSENCPQASLRAFCILALAGAIEISQALIYHNKTEWLDFGVDGVGILVAFAAIRIWHFRR